MPGFHGQNFRENFHGRSEDQCVRGKVVHQRYDSRFRPESGVFLEQTQIWILSGPEQNQIRIWTGSGQHSDFSFEIERLNSQIQKNSKNSKSSKN